MGADIIGWRECPLQAELGPDGFLGKLKLGAYKRAVEQQLPQDKWASAKLRVQVSDRATRDLTYAEIVTELREFEQGIPDCKDCPLAGGRPLGCYRYVTYPVDATFERSMFEFFVGQVTTFDSICNQLYRDLFSQLEPGEGWYEPRGGGPGTIADLAEPLDHAWVDDEGQDHFIDSAMVLLICFINLDHPALVAAYGRFWSEFIEFCDAKTAGISVTDEGIEVQVDATDLDELDAEELARRAVTPLEIAGSRTLEEIRHVRDMLVQTGARAVDPGWRVVTDA